MIAPFSVKGQKTINETETKMEKETKGLKFKLSEATESGTDTKKERISLVEGERLSETEVGSLLSRIPPIKVEPPSDFSVRDKTLPPPKTGKIVPIKFEPSLDKESPEESPNKPLEIVRYSPEGNVPIAGDLSVTFSHSMVAITSQEQASQTVPVKLTPQPAGKWRWLGTKTLIFDPERRFPMATEFTATVPKGTKSINGQVLQENFTWKFTTPPPKIEQTFPTNGSQTRRNPLIFIAFDQEINPEAMIKSISVTSGGKTFPIRLATEEEISKDEIVKEYVKRAKSKYWLVFRPVNTDGTTENVLPYDSTVRVTVQKGAPSAEGPLTTTTDQGFSFKTFGQMRLVETLCLREKCSPFDDWFFRFTNPISQSDFDPSMIKISPPIENAQVYPAGNYFYVSGYKKGRTSYKITIDESLKDIYGQTLGKSATAIINVGQADPMLFPSDRFIVLDPTIEPTFSFYSINLPSAKVSLYKVQPSDWYQFKKLFSYSYEDKTPSIPGKLIEQKTIKIEQNPDDVVETKIDLSKALTKGLGNVIVVVEPTIKLSQKTKIITWCQATQIGVDVLSDNEELVALVTDLKTGKPIPEAQVEIYPDATKAKPDADGIVKLSLPASPSQTTKLLIARKGNDVAFLPEEGQNYYWYSATRWVKRAIASSLRWFIFDDRKTYRPKEEVSVKGYVRIYEGGKFGDIKAVEDKIRKITYTVSDSRQNEIAKGELNLNSFGAFDFRFKLPDNVNLGEATIMLLAETSLSGNVAYHSFEIQEFRRPEFEVTAKNESEPPYFLKESALVSVEAKYYAGGGLANADLEWLVSAEPTNYTPPNRSDFFFGIWKPWWWDYDFFIPERKPKQTQRFKSRTNAVGKHVLKIDFESIEGEPARPYALEASVSVEDVNRQRWASSTNLLVHPSSLYVGLRTKRNFVSKGDTFVVESIITDIDGNLIPERDFQIIAELTTQKFERGKWKETKLDEQVCNLKSTQGVSKCEFKASYSGKYMIKARILDDKKRLNETHIPIWVSGLQLPKETNVKEQKVQLIPDKTLYSVGDNAEILVISPFPEAEGILTLDKNGIVKTEKISIRDSSAIVKIPILESYLPNVHVSVHLNGSAPLSEKEPNNKKPAFATGTINLEISKARRSLSVSVTPEKQNLEPGGNTKVNLEVKNFDGVPVSNSEIAVVAVDEAILALANYKIQNPLDVFYSPNQSIVIAENLRRFVLLKDIDKPEKKDVRGVVSEGAVSYVVEGVTPKSALPSKSVLKEAETSGQTQTIPLRKDFNPLALFLASAKTDSQGKATVDLKLPDNLTRYRITAVSVDKSGKLFGLGESSVTARKPLMIRPSLPRFMNFGDSAELPVVLQNQTETPLTVDVAIRVANVELKGVSGKRVVVPANDRVEVRFPVFASQAGIAHFQFVASSGKWADAAEISIPVWTPATTEAFATYGTTDKDEVILNKVIAPQNVYAQFGGLEVTTSSTRLQELTDAFIYLCDYPFESSESIASRIIAISAMQDVLKAFKAKDLPSDEAIRAKIEQDIKILKSRQRYDGSFGIWSREEERFKYPFLTVHVAHALIRAKAKGYDVPEDMLKKAMSYVKDIEDKFDEWHKRLPKLRWTVLAYSLYVRNLAGDKDTNKALKLMNEAMLENLPFEAVGWILSVLADSKHSTEIATIKRFLMNRVAETASTANFVTNYEDGKWLIMHSNRRADGVILEALLKVDKQNDLIPKLVRGLLEHRTKGRWETTQENVFILLALRKYFDTYESVTPDFIARIWLGEAYAGEQTFKGRSVDSNALEIPMHYLVKQNGNADLILQKQGPGRLYYRIGMKYAPKNLTLKPVDYGFTVLRRYEAVDSPDDVKQNPDGSWTIKTGARVRVHLTLVAPSRRYHVALVDPLPAGLEILNPELAVTEKLPEKQDTIVSEYGSRSFMFDFWWRRNWFEHQNFRDERAEVFSSLVWGGVYEFSYYARATTPGEFIVPPAKAEEMYSPETLGRTGTDFVKIE
jgi:uncharacterized protein YfaS (alpha-2-macroglobulin family)